MSDRERQHFLAEYDEALMELLMQENAEAEGEALWEAFQKAKESEALPEFPKDLDQSCRKMIRSASEQQARTVFLKRMGIGMKRAAVFALIFLCLASTAVMSVDAIRIPVMNFFVMNKERYSVIYFGDDVPQENENDLSLEEQLLQIRPPKGYQILTHDSFKDSSTYLVYIDENKTKMNISFYLAKGLIHLDSEDVVEIETKINDFDAIFIKKKGLRIVWYDSQRGGIFDIRADDLSEDEFWKFVYRVANM